MSSLSNTEVNWSHKTQNKNSTLAWGFNVDRSEDKEPTDELGDKPGPLEAEAETAHSELDDTELPGLPWEFIDCGSLGALLGAGTSGCSQGELVFSLLFDGAQDGAYEEAFADSPTPSEPSMLPSNESESTRNIAPR